MVVKASDYLDEIKRMQQAIRSEQYRILAGIDEPEKKRQMQERIYKLDWHVQGQMYHIRNMIHLYGQIVGEAAGKVLSLIETTKQPVDAMLTGNVLLPDLYYEFYAFVNLYRISLDYFHRTLAFKFENPSNLPKSFSKLVSRTTDCPVMERMANDAVIAYFKDFRDCLNHYRTFSTNHIFLLLEESVDENETDAFDTLTQIEPFILRPSLLDGNSNVIVNFFLPDKIFEDGTDNKLVNQFEYTQKKNMIATVMHALRSVVGNYLHLLSELSSDNVFHYNKHKFEQAVEYTPFI